MVPEHPVLRPGVRLVRRPDGRWQTDGLAFAPVVLDDSPVLARLARALTHPWQPIPGGCEDHLARISHLLVEAGTVPRPGSDAAGIGAQADLLATYGPQAPAVGSRRRRSRVAVTGPAVWVGHAHSLLAAGGVRGDDRSADVRLALYAGEPDPRRIEDLTRRNAAHLWAGTSNGIARVGPFVDPGRTACWSCVSAHRGVRTPGWALLRAQHAAPVGVPEPVDPARMALAIAWAVADLLRWIDGEQPSTWSATVEVGPDLVTGTDRWRRHPDCGCSWSGAWVGELTG